MRPDLDDAQLAVLSKLNEPADLSVDNWAINHTTRITDAYGAGADRHKRLITIEITSSTGVVELFEIEITRAVPLEEEE